MFSLIKRLLLYIYIVVTKFKQRTAVIERLKHASRSQRDISYDKPGLPDLLDNCFGVPDGWSEFQVFTGFNKDGTCVHFYHSNGGNKKEVYLHLPAVGTLMYSESDTVGKNDESNSTNKKRLTIEVENPMKKWKLSFRGHMKKITSGTNVTTGTGGQNVFVRFHLYWNNIGDPYDLWLDTPGWLLAGECSNLRLSDAVSLLSSKSIWFQQWGEIQGSFTVEENDFRIRLSACRERKYVTDNAYEYHIQDMKSEFVEVDHIAHKYVYNIVSFRDGRHMKFGRVLFPFLESYHFTKVQDKNSEDKCSLLVCGKELRTSRSRSLIENTDTEIRYSKYSMDNRIATGLELLTRHVLEAQTNLRSLQTDVSVEDDDENVLFLDLSDPRCRFKTLVGGKAANLSYLLSFGYNVPSAFCLTTNAFHATVERNPHLLESINNIERTIREMKHEKLKSACDEAVRCCRNISIEPDIVKAIEAKIQDMTSLQNKGVAVRSSAKGEDGEVLSAAGQLETILGIRSLNGVIDAIKACWSSYFSFQSVEYRRQNGQVIMDGMGVIIQEMIESEVSGVMMTNDPLTGREDRILINASYKLGEAVVSGITEPDSILIGVEEDGRFTILKEIVGSKSKKVDIIPTGGTCIKEISTSECLCLSETMIHSLCKVGKSIERSFQSEQDIEWAVNDGCVYILQSRPITSIEEETDEDLFHEFDSPVSVETDLITTCNIQEMMPGAMSTLTVSTFVPVVVEGFYFYHCFVGMGNPRLYHPTGVFLSYGNSALLNFSPIYLMGVNSIGGLKAKAFVEIDVLGEERKEVTTDQILNFKGTALNTFWKIGKCAAYKMLFENPKFNRDVLKWESNMHMYVIGEESDDASGLFKNISKERINLLHIFILYYHIMYSQNLSIVKSILMGDSLNFSKENKEDMSNLLLKCGTISADVPKAITKLAKAIQTCGVSEEFINLSDEGSLTLLTEDADLQGLFGEFMKKHGHRGIREAEFIEKSWTKDPTKLVRALKIILKNGFIERKDEPEDESVVEEVVSKLKTRVTPFKRWLIRKLMKTALQKVIDREKGKNLVIKIIDSFKTAYWLLADKMVREGRLPDEELLFFLTHREIGELINTRSPKLMRKAKRRMKIFPRQQAIRFERISFGMPKPITGALDTVSETLQPTDKMEGMPNGNGEAVGRACIVTNEEDVKHIKKGDIMICPYTDIGWSPYFPLINGLVTEIGSTISHGAVVARECGIPCVVNVANATKLLKTGDIVQMNGSKGTVEKLPAN